uniref:MULE domain-containing protein n=1 Tax=Romanomermis culicivorax TaxID=13658 RepID=A0A915IVP2_ROMCU
MQNQVEQTPPTYTSIRSVLYREEEERGGCEQDRMEHRRKDGKNMTTQKSYGKKLIPINDIANLLRIPCCHALLPDPRHPMYKRLFGALSRAIETWLNGRWQVNSWNHFTNEWWDAPLLGLPGPRTTNHAEGWHNRLNNDFGHSRPRLNTFLNWLQQTNHVNQVRMMQLRNGEWPRPRESRYVQVDANLARAKLEFIRRITANQNAGNFALQIIEIEPYLRHVRSQRKKEKKIKWNRIKDRTNKDKVEDQKHEKE